MIFIDSDASMYPELPTGTSQFVQESAKIEKTQTNQGFEFISDDREFIVVDNSRGVFKDSNRLKVTDKLLTTADIKNAVISLLNEQILNDPEYAQKTMPSITIITDGDIPTADQQSC